MPFIESSTEPLRLENYDYYKDHVVIASKNGIIITTIGDRNYTIWADRSKLPAEQQQFYYMSVFSYQGDQDSSAFALWSKGAVENGHGLYIYNDSHGYGSYNSLQHYVVFLFDTDKKLIGTIDFKNIR